MVKKAVPDWLNSSLWSTTSPPDDDRFNRYISKSTTTSTAEFTTNSTAPVAEPQVVPPVPVPPAAVVRQEPTNVEIRDPLNNNDNDSSTNLSAEDISRQAQLLQELSKKVINMGEVRRIASQGIPDGAGIRSTVWKLLLGYLPNDRGLWLSELAKKRSQYKHFKDELLMNPSVRNHKEVG